MTSGQAGALRRRTSLATGPTQPGSLTQVRRGIGLATATTTSGSTQPERQRSGRKLPEAPSAGVRALGLHALGVSSQLAIASQRDRIKFLHGMKANIYLIQYSSKSCIPHQHWHRGNSLQFEASPVRENAFFLMFTRPSRLPLPSLLVRMILIVQFT